MLMIEFAGLLSICGFRYDFNIIQRSEYGRQALSGDRVIVGDDNPDLFKRAISRRARLDMIITACGYHRTTSLLAASAEVLKLIVVTTFFGFANITLTNSCFKRWNRVYLRAAW